MKRQNSFDQLYVSFGEIPGWLVKATRKYLVIRTGDGDHKITIEDVVKYYAYERNFWSGVRKLGTIIGDWRNIDYLAEFIHECFKILNPDKLRQVAKRYGLTSKF